MIFHVMLTGVNPFHSIDNDIHNDFLLNRVCDFKPDYLNQKKHHIAFIKLLERLITPNVEDRYSVQDVLKLKMFNTIDNSQFYNNDGCKDFSCRGVDNKSLAMGKKLKKTLNYELPDASFNCSLKDVSSFGSKNSEGERDSTTGSEKVMKGFKRQDS